MPHFRPTDATFYGFLTVLALCLLGVGGDVARAQSPALSSERQPVRIGVTPAYQSYTLDGATSTQASTVLDVLVPLTPRWQIQAAGRVAQSTSDAGPDVRGLDDANVALLYAQPVGKASLVGRVDVSVPIGKQELTLEELQTIQAVSNGLFDYRVPGFGTGFSIAPRITYAFPVGDRLALGIGSSVRIAGAYQPVAGMVREYSPGTGIEAFAGAELELTDRSALAFDGRFVQYGTDRVGTQDRLDAGYLVSGTGQYTYTSGFRTLRVEARYRYWSKGDVYQQIFGVNETTFRAEQQLTPSQGRLRAGYRTRLSPGWFVGGSATGHVFQATEFVDAQQVVRARLYTSVRLMDGFFVVPQGTYTAGTFRGYTVALRTEVRF